jgi:hypothetical protein
VRRTANVFPAASPIQNTTPFSKKEHNMGNANTFSQISGLSVTPLPTTETIILFPGQSAATTRATSLLGIRSDLAQQGTFDGRPFRLTLSGNATASASENFTFAVYLNNATVANTNLTTFTNDIKVVNTTTMATGAAGTLAFSISAFCLWNSTSATAGRFAFYPEPGGLKSISGTSAVSVATAVIGNSGTAITSTLPLVQFYVTALTGTADTTSTCNLTLQLDQI